jgi:hypothetical protein
MRIFRLFGGSAAFAFLALAAAFGVGYCSDRSLSAGISALYAAAILGVLETSLSLDNAVVNARILGRMTRFWRKMFVTAGMAIAVFGMRILLPLLIVWAVGDRPLSEVAASTWRDPREFQGVLVAQHARVAGFGGAFLWMVFFRFFMDARKKHHWLGWIERGLARIGRMESAWIGSALALSFAFHFFVPARNASPFLAAAMAGMLAHLLVEGLGGLLGRGSTGAATVVGGLSGFLYLEVLDASFSLDGVVGAFAISDDLYVIALGLGIGAMFVRSLTLAMVEMGSLSRFAHLESGAFWAIGALALVLFLSTVGIQVPSPISGSMGLVPILASLFSSRGAGGPDPSYPSPPITSS